MQSSAGQIKRRNLNPTGSVLERENKLNFTTPFPRSQPSLVGLRWKSGPHHSTVTPRECLQHRKRRQPLRQPGVRLASTNRTHRNLHLPPGHWDRHVDRDIRTSGMMLCLCWAAHSPRAQRTCPRGKSIRSGRRRSHIPLRRNRIPLKVSNFFDPFAHLRSRRWRSRKRNER